VKRAKSELEEEADEDEDEGNDNDNPQTSSGGGVIGVRYFSLFIENCSLKYLRGSVNWIREQCLVSKHQKKHGNPARTSCRI
jgi:hypothetical protein